MTDFKSQNVDPYALSGTNSVVSSANKAAAGKETERAALHFRDREQHA